MNNLHIFGNINRGHANLKFLMLNEEFSIEMEFMLNDFEDYAPLVCKRYANILNSIEKSRIDINNLFLS